MTRSFTTTVDVEEDSDYACCTDLVCEADAKNVVRIDGDFDGFAACDEHLDEVILSAVETHLLEVDS